MSIEVAVRVNEQGQLHIPDEIQQHLFPGMVVVLKLPEVANGTDSTGNGLHDNSAIESGLPGLVRKDGILIYRGAVAEGFDWDAFMQEDREAPNHPFEPDLR